MAKKVDAKLHWNMPSPGEANKNVCGRWDCRQSAHSSHTVAAVDTKSKSYDMSNDSKRRKWNKRVFCG